MEEATQTWTLNSLQSAAAQALPAVYASPAKADRVWTCLPPSVVWAGARNDLQDPQ